MLDTNVYLSVGGMVTLEQVCLSLKLGHQNSDTTLQIDNIGELSTILKCYLQVNVS